MIVPDSNCTGCDKGITESSITSLSPIQATGCHLMTSYSMTCRSTINKAKQQWELTLINAINKVILL
jgi:hypothetical protein